MDKLKKTIEGLDCCLGHGKPTPRLGNEPRDCENCPYARINGINNILCFRHLQRDALELLKVQELPPVKPEKLEERTTKWLDNMTAEERLKEIAAILDDWDGYRTAKGLGGLINEVWAYALYPVKVHEPRLMTLEEVVSHGDKEAMYLERMDGEMIVRPVVLLTTFLDMDKDCLHFAGGWRCCGSFGINGYGKTWRCWTSRPTDEQREAVKWE